MLYIQGALKEGNPCRTLPAKPFACVVLLYGTDRQAVHFPNNAIILRFPYLSFPNWSEQGTDRGREALIVSWSDVDHLEYRWQHLTVQEKMEIMVIYVQRKA